MDEDKLAEFAAQLGADTDDVMDRWHQRPDLIVDDVFRVEDIDTGQPRELELFDVQRELVHAYFYSDAGTINAYKGRRIGYSFIVIACFLLEGLLYPNSYYPLVSRSLTQSKSLIDDIDSLIENAKIEIPTTKSNTDYIELWNGTAFEAFSSDSDTSRGRDSARAVLLDEMAFIEDEEQAYRAFGAFLALGENRKMVEVSTPNTKNDLFMQEHREGSPNGDNGILSIKQPTFTNANEIDIYTPLYEQETVPARPEINIDHLETQRKSDPEGFGQEYLCRPVVDEYRFFDEDAIERAIERSLEGYEDGLSASKPHGARRIMGVDIGINRDDTVLSVMDHQDGRRQQRALIVVDEDWLRRAGVRNPDRGNANDIAELVNHVKVQMDVDMVVMDKGGVGQTFDRIIHEKLGRGYTGFDFSDKEAVADMMGDTNIALHNNDIILLDDERLFDELSSIVKEKRDHYQRPKFSGKEHSESGKDDTAIATVMSAFPPTESSEPATSPAEQNKHEPMATSPSKKSTEPEELGFAETSVTRTTRSRRDKYQRRSQPRR